MLLQRIKDASLAARKDKESDPEIRAERTATLITLYSEAQRIGKDDGNRQTTDTEVIEVLKKFIKDINTFMSAAVADTARTAALVREKALLESFLPKQATEAEINEVVQETIRGGALRGPRAIGPIMAALKAKFGVNFDGGMAKRLATEALT